MFEDEDALKAVKLLPLNICNEPPILNDWAIPAPPDKISDPVEIVVEFVALTIKSLSALKPIPPDNINSFLYVAIH